MKNYKKAVSGNLKEEKNFTMYFKLFLYFTNTQKQYTACHISLSER